MDFLSVYAEYDCARKSTLLRELTDIQVICSSSSCMELFYNWHVLYLFTLKARLQNKMDLLTISFQMVSGGQPILIYNLNIRHCSKETFQPLTSALRGKTLIHRPYSPAWREFPKITLKKTRDYRGAE